MNGWRKMMSYLATHTPCKSNNGVSFEINIFLNNTKYTCNRTCSSWIKVYYMRATSTMEMCIWSCSKINKAYAHSAFQSPFRVSNSPPSLWEVSTLENPLSLDCSYQTIPSRSYCRPAWEDLKNWLNIVPSYQRITVRYWLETPLKFDRLKAIWRSSLQIQILHIIIVLSSRFI